MRLRGATAATGPGTAQGCNRGGGGQTSTGLQSVLNVPADTRGNNSCHPNGARAQAQLSSTLRVVVHPILHRLVNANFINHLTWSTRTDINRQSELPVTMMAITSHMSRVSATCYSRLPTHGGKGSAWAGGRGARVPDCAEEVPPGGDRRRR